MKTASPELIELLNGSDQFLMADLYTITLRAGDVVRYTSSDLSIVSGAHTFLANGPILKRGQTRCMIGLEVDTLDLTVSASQEHLLNGVPFVASAIQGALDGAQVELRRAFLSSWLEPVVGTLLLFSGRVSDVDATRSELSMKVKSDLELLNIKMPHTVFEPSCTKVLYSPACGVNKADFVSTGYTVIEPSTRSTLYTDIPGGLAGFPFHRRFELGLLAFTSGENAGITRSVKSQNGGRLTFAFPFPYNPAVGDTFHIWPGCTKTRDGNGCEKFGNLPRFRGFPFVPAPETVT